MKAGQFYWECHRRFAALAGRLMLGIGHVGPAQMSVVCYTECFAPDDEEHCTGVPPHPVNVWGDGGVLIYDSRSGLAERGLVPARGGDALSSGILAMSVLRL